MPHTYYVHTHTLWCPRMDDVVDMVLKVKWYTKDMSKRERETDS